MGRSTGIEPVITDPQSAVLPLHHDRRAGTMYYTMTVPAKPFQVIDLIILPVSVFVVHCQHPFIS